MIWNCMSHHVTIDAPTHDLHSDGSRGAFIDMDSRHLFERYKSLQSLASTRTLPNAHAEDVLWFHDSLFAELHYKLLVDSDDCSTASMG